MNPIAFTDIQIQGELLRRAALNLARLGAEQYCYPAIFRAPEYDWPGDWEGRTILALTMLAQALGQEPEQLQAIIPHLPEHLNERGYFGRMLPAGLADEQQLSGHNWMLRALIEYYNWKKDPQVLAFVESIARNLLLSAQGLYAGYMAEVACAAAEARAGEAIGSLQGEPSGNWYLSTDVGCAFIMLDGATHAYQLLGWPELAALIEEMIRRLAAMDLIALSFQTHATLSATRGLLRHYESVGDPELLGLAERIFALYRREAMTEHDANYNWFDRGGWTEPCAIVDSYMIAVALFRHRGKVEYLELAHQILYNGLGHAQRPNGGFGCDCCLGLHDGLLYPHRDIFEASWCCTMRGGDGLAHAIGNCYLVDANSSAITVAFPQPSTASFSLAEGRLELQQRTQYPYAGEIELQCTQAAQAQTITLRFYIPSWVKEDEAKLLVNRREVAAVFREGLLEWTGMIEEGTVCEARYPIGLRSAGTSNWHSVRPYTRLYHGNLLLGADVERPSGSYAELQVDESQLHYMGEGQYACPSSGIKLAPIDNALDLTMEEAMELCRQALFPARANERNWRRLQLLEGR